MAATTTLLGLVTPTQGTLSGTWGDTVNYGISDYVDISVAGTLTLTNDGAVTLANTTGDASASNITSTLTGAGTVTAQFAIVRVTGTLTVAKVVTGPAYSKTYTVVNAATGGIVTFKAAGQTGVSVAVGESAFVYFNGTDYVKIVGTATAGAAGGSTTQVQYNNAGVLAGITGATTNGTILTLVTPVLGVATATSLQGIIGNVTPAAGTFTQIDITAQGTLRLQDTTGGEYVALRAPASLAGNYTLTFPADDGTSGQALITDGSGVLSWSTAASGDVYGPASATNNGIVLFDGTTGKIIKNSATQDGLIYGITVGRGAGAVSTNTAVGVSAGAANSTGNSNTYLGWGVSAAGAGNTGSGNLAAGFNALNVNTSGTSNVALGGGINAVIASALESNTTGSYNVAVGTAALKSNTTASNNTAVGYQAGYSVSTSPSNTFLGYQAGYSTTNASNTHLGFQAGYTATTGTNNLTAGSYAGYSLTTGTGNTFVGGSFNFGSGYYVTTGSKNTILGSYNGNQGGLDIRTASNYIVLSDGDGNPLISTADNQTVALEGAVPNSGTGITFPATQSASSNANTLDDYEEGTWTPTLTPATSGTITLVSPNLCAYTKIGRVVTVNGVIESASVSSPVGSSVTFNNLPFASNATGTQRTAGVARGFFTSGSLNTTITIVSSVTTFTLHIDASLFQLGSQVYFQLSYIVD